MAEMKDVMRCLSFCRPAPAAVRADEEANRVMLSRPDKGTIAIAAAAFEEVVRRGLVRSAEAGVAITPEGRKLLARVNGGERGDGFRAQQQEREVAQIDHEGTRQAVLVDRAESPLAQLAGRRDRRGRPFLTGDEVAAGERLRADFTYGQLQPRLGVNWTAAGVPRGHEAMEFSESTLAARQRVDRAIEAIGPELAGIVLDICCFLKGLEQVEQERGWPRRSAKLMLKAGLASLDRHYRPRERSRSGRRPSLRHWGAADFRPRVGMAQEGETS